MKKINWVCLCIFILLTGFADHSTITVFMIGDSTMADKPLEDNPERGWGMMFQQYFDSSVIIENHAMNGRSTKTFIAENRWDSVYNKLKPGDYVIIQFGHNDGSPEKKDRYTPPEDYRKNLVFFITKTRSKQANPILCTPIARRRFNEQSQFYDTHGVYPDIVRRVADSLHVTLLDMHRKSEKLVAAAGVEESKKIYLWIQPGEYKSLPNGREDNTHFSAYGANIMAQLAVEGLKETSCGLASRLKK
jgi:DNA sulfur modification protein DndE